jgi:hypothetical protein
MNETARILCAIKPDESVTFRTLWKRLPDVDLTRVMDVIDTFEKQELVVVDNSRHFTEVRLTPLGVERAREAMEGASQ